MTRVGEYLPQLLCRVISPFILPSGIPLIRGRPFRAPHNTISHTGLLAGGVGTVDGENVLGAGESSQVRKGGAVGSGTHGGNLEVHAAIAVLGR